MWTKTLRIASDYNRALPKPIRWLHVAAAALHLPLRANWRWFSAESRRHATLPLLAALVLFLLLFPFDGPISRTLRTLKLGGDVRDELQSLGQYGQLTFSLLGGLAVWLLDPPRRRRLLDWIAAALVAAVVASVLKALVGRPRPVFDDPAYFLGPWGIYPVTAEVGLRHAWEVGSGISSRLWSMPSSHALYATVMSVFLAHLYPRLWPLSILLACIVGLSRVVLGAHYPTDVFVGAALGYIVAHHAARGYWGVRAVDWLWLRFVDPQATRAYPAPVGTPLPVPLARPEPCPEDTAGATTDAPAPSLPASAGEGG